MSVDNNTNTAHIKNERLFVWYQAETNVLAIWHVMPDDRVSLETRYPWAEIGTWVPIGDF